MAPKLAHLMKMINLQSPKFNELQKEEMYILYSLTKIKQNKKFTKTITLQNLTFENEEILS